MKMVEKTLSNIKSIAVKAGRFVGVMMRLRNFIPEKVKLQLCRTTILPQRATYRDKVLSNEELMAGCCWSANIVLPKTPGNSHFTVHG